MDIYVVGAHLNCLYKAIPMCTNTTYVTEIKETFFEMYTKHTKQVSCPLTSSFEHLKLPVSIKIPVTIW